MEGEYRLAEQTPTNRFAVVQVVVQPDATAGVVVSPDAFAWLQVAHGPSAQAQLGLFQDYVHEATEGALGALSEAEVAARVTVTHIEYAPADTRPGDVRDAAARAVLAAIEDPAPQ